MLILVLLMQTFYNYFMSKPLVNYKRAKKVLKDYDIKTGKYSNKNLQRDTNLFLNLFKKQSIYQRIIKPLFVLSLISVCFVWIFVLILSIFNLY